MNYIEDVLKHAEKVYPQECCGIIASRPGQEEFFIPITNIADEPEIEFEFSKKEYMEAYLQHDIKAIVHSHVDSDATPSEHDTKACNFIQIPYLIVSHPGQDVVYLEPKHE